MAWARFATVDFDFAAALARGAADWLFAASLPGASAAATALVCAAVARAAEAASSSAEPLNCSGALATNGHLNLVASTSRLESASAAADASDSSRQRSVPPCTAARVNSTVQLSGAVGAALLAGVDAAAVGAGAATRPAGSALFAAGGKALIRPSRLRITSSTGRTSSRSDNRTMRSNGRTSASVTASRSKASKSPLSAPGLPDAARPCNALIWPVSIATRPESLTTEVGVCSKAIVKSAFNTPPCTRNGKLSGR